MCGFTKFLFKQMLKVSVLKNKKALFTGKFSVKVFHKSTRQLLLWAIFDNLLTIFSALNATCLVLGTNKNINQPHLLTKKVVKACGGDATIFSGSIITVLGPCYETLSISFRPSYSLESDFRISIVFRISISYSRKQ
mgnify:CR=1 FL=1